MTYRSTNPAKLDDVVAEIKLSDPDAIVAAARAAKSAQRA